MPRHNAYRGRAAVEPVGGEWSSGQLGIGFAVAVIFGLVCFMLGYSVANVDHPIDTGINVTAVPPEDDAKAPAVTASNPASNGAETAPAAPKQPVTGPAVTAPANPSAGAGSAATRTQTPSGPSRPSDAITRPGAIRPEVGALGSPGQPTPMVKTAVNINKSPTEVTSSTGSSGTQPPITPPSPDTPVTAPAEPATQVAANTGNTQNTGNTENTESAPPSPLDELESVSTGPVPAKPAPAAAPPVTATPAKPAPSPAPSSGKLPSVTRGTYGVQVAAFNGPRRTEQAQESQKRLKAETGLEANIIASEDGAYSKVVITGFSTRDAARDQCEKLKKKAGYGSAWVVRLP